MTDAEYYTMWQTNSKNPMLFLENTRFLARERCNYIVAQQCAGCQDEDLVTQMTKNMAISSHGTILGGQLATFVVGIPEIEPYQEEFEKTSGRAHERTQAHDRYRSWYLRRLDELPPLALKYATADSRYVLYGFILFALTRKHRNTDPEHNTDFCRLLVQVMEAIRKDCSVPFVFHPPGFSTIEELKNLPQHTLLIDAYRFRLEQCLAQTRTVAKVFYTQWRADGCRRAARANFWTAMRNLLYHWFNTTDLVTPNMRGLVFLQRRLLWDIWSEWNNVLCAEWSEMICHQVRAGKTLRPMVMAKDTLPPMSRQEADDILVRRKVSWDLEPGLRAWFGWQRIYFSVTPKSLGYLSWSGKPRDVAEVGLLEHARIHQEEMAINPEAGTSNGAAVSNALPELDSMVVPQEDLKGTYAALLAASELLVIEIPNDHLLYPKEEVIEYTMGLVRTFRHPEKHALLPVLTSASSEDRMQRFLAALESRGAPDEWYLLQLDGVIDQLLSERKISLADYANLVDYALLRLGNYLLLSPHFLWKYIMYPLTQQHSGAGPSILPVSLSQVMERAHPMVPPHIRLELQRWRMAHFALPKPGVQAAVTGEGGSYLHPAADSGVTLDSRNVTMAFPVGRSTYLEMAYQIQGQGSEQCLWLTRNAGYGITQDPSSRPTTFFFQPTFYEPRQAEASWSQVVVDGGLPSFQTLALPFPTRLDTDRDAPLAGEPHAWPRTEDRTQHETGYEGPSSVVAPSSASSSSYPPLA